MAHVLLSYFVSLPSVYAMMRHSPGENWGSFAFVFLIAAALWFDVAWFREQFCIVLCPYGPLAIRTHRRRLVGGGLRTPNVANPGGAKARPGPGDCVDCQRCVQVCPTGIDIRQGLQLECIGCTACIDACNTVMKKVGRPPGLIRYDSQHGFAGSRTRWIRSRTLVYTGLALLGAAALTAATSTLKPVSVGLTRVTGIPYLVENGVVRNQFLVRLLNKRNAPATFRIEIAGGPPSLHWTGADESIPVASLGEEMRTVVLTLPRAELKAELPLLFRIRSSDGTIIEKPAVFLGPTIP